MSNDYSRACRRAGRLAGVRVDPTMVHRRGWLRFDGLRSVGTVDDMSNRVIRITYCVP